MKKALENRDHINDVLKSLLPGESPSGGGSSAANRQKEQQHTPSIEAGTVTPGSPTGPREAPVAPMPWGGATEGGAPEGGAVPSTAPVSAQHAGGALDPVSTLEPAAVHSGVGRSNGDPALRPMAQIPAVVHPTLEDLGRSGAHYLLSEPSWVRRHVETVTLKNLYSVRRSLTIDIELPREPDCVALRDGSKSVYFLPVATLAKEPLTSYIDVTDESGRSLPLLTRSENASVSSSAVIEAARRLLDEEPPLELQRAWAETIKRSGDSSALALLIAEDLMKQLRPDIESRQGYDWFTQALHDLAANSLVWLPLHGHGGERRIVKLHYDAIGSSLDFRPKRDMEIFVEAVLNDGLTHVFRIVEPGDGDRRGRTRRILSWTGNALGLTARGVKIGKPYTRGSISYHLQVEAPPGLEIQKLEPPQALHPGSKAHQHIKAESDGDSGHLYLSGVEVVESDPAKLWLRVDRRGFLSLATMSAALIVAMLWAYDAAAPINLANSHPEVAAAVLLVVPVLLLTFAVRLTEHPYVTSMLTGVRVCILTLGLLAVADAAAIVNVEPPHWSLHHTWFIYAVAGSVVSSVLVLGWLLALRTTRRIWDQLNVIWELRAAYVFCCLGASALTSLALAAGDLDTRVATAVPALGVGLPLVLMLLCWALLASPKALDARLPAGLCWLSGVVAVAGAGLLLAGAIDGVRWHDAWLVLAPVVALATVALLAYEVAGHLLARAQAARARAGSTA